MREETFGERLKELRISKGLGQLDFAKQIGAGKSVISKWERGESEPTLPYLISIANFFEISLDVLSGRED